MPKMFYTYLCSFHGEFDIREEMDQDHQYRHCPECGGPSSRVFNHFSHIWPDVLWHKDGSKQDPSELPPAPMDHNYGWHGFGESKLHITKD